MTVLYILAVLALAWVVGELVGAIADEMWYRSTH